MTDKFQIYLKPTFFIDSDSLSVQEFAYSALAGAKMEQDKAIKLYYAVRDGIHDSIFHPFDQAGQRHMEYLRDHGQFADLPFDQMCQAFAQGYPHLFGIDSPGWPQGNFEREAVSDRA
jgi:hypothetical protein